MPKKKRKRRVWKKIIMLAPEPFREYLSDNWKKRFDSMQSKNSICPAWENCNKKSCIEREQCTSKEYWTSELSASHRKELRNAKKVSKLFEFQNQNPQLGCGYRCDKKTSCSILGQCIFTIQRFQDKPELLGALQGKMTPKAVIKILREHDPEPMASYYPRKKIQKK